MHFRLAVGVNIPQEYVSMEIKVHHLFAWLLHVKGKNFYIKLFIFNWYSCKYITLFITYILFWSFLTKKNFLACFQERLIPLFKSLLCLRQYHKLVVSIISQNHTFFMSLVIFMVFAKVGITNISAMHKICTKSSWYHESQL